jgi:hypothetical protein
MLTIHVTADLERMLVDVDALKQNDPRLQRRSAEDEEEEDYVARSIKTGGGGKTSATENEDSDWD